ncbi:MAG: HPF/RaiA family ribosome-associated protein [Planctomycetota bacterium]
MDVDPVVSFHKMEPDRHLEAEAHERVGRLERFCEHIIAARVTFEKQHDHRYGDGTYRVRVELTVPPGHDLVVDKTSSDAHDRLDAGSTMRDAMKAMEARLKKLRGKQQGRVKQHPEQQTTAVVAEIGSDHGFLRTPEQRRIYFHANSVLDPGFAALHVGTGVHFAEEMGEKGPQASSVRITEEEAAPVSVHHEFRQSRP